MNWRTCGNISIDVWRSELGRVKSPLLPIAQSAYDAAKPHTALALAMLWVESQYATAFNRNKPENKNALNLRPPTGGGYMAFATWPEGVIAWRERLTDPQYKGGIYARTTDLPSLIHVYAPGSDDNNEAEYVATIETLFARWGVQGGPMPDTATKPSILLIAGHRNATGGNAFEQSLTDDLARAYRDVLRPAGYAVTWLQEADGDADPDDTVGGLDSVSNQARLWCAKTPGQKVVLDLHSEGTAPSVRGGFAIVPDKAHLRTAVGVPQLDTDNWTNNVLDRRLGRAFIDRFRDATGIPLRATGVREPGLMSETQTNVAITLNARLATFAYTSPHAGDTVRLVVEHGAHSNAQDNAIQRRPEFPRLCAVACLEALQAVYGIVPDSAQPKPGKPSWDPATDLGVVDHHGTPVYALRAKVRCIKEKGTWSHVAATSSSKRYKKFAANEEAIVVGTLPNGWLFLEVAENGELVYPRATRTAFVPKLPRPQDA